MLANPKFVNGASTVDAVYTGGDVGIGINDPVSRLHLGGSNPILTFTNSAGTVGERGFRIAFDNDRLTFQRASDL